jgi:hypothetical protein
LSAVFELALLGIGTDEPDEIDVILEHKKYLLSLARLCRGTRRSKGAAPKPRRKVFGTGTQTCFGEGVQTRRGAQQKFRTRAQGAGITRSECPVEMG